MRLLLDELQPSKTQRTGGFTLIELMVVIVIVGILSAVMLPMFLSQKNKSQATEATSKLAALLKATHAEYRYDNKIGNAFIGATDAARDANTGGIFTYSTDGNTAALASETNADGHSIFFLNTKPKTVADGGDAALFKSASGKKIYACVNLTTGEINIDRTFRSSRAESKNNGINCAGNN